jgi:hypothetical protein
MTEAGIQTGQRAEKTGACIQTLGLFEMQTEGCTQSPD